MKTNLQAAEMFKFFYRRFFFNNHGNIFQLILFAGVIFLFVAAVFPQTDKDCKPSVSSIGKAMRVDGTIRFGVLYASCIPMPENRPPSKLYDPYEGEKLITNLKDSHGRIVNSFVWHGEKYLSSVKMTRYEIIGGREALKTLSAGDYTLEFAVGDDVFYTFAFTVKTRKSGDPYNPGTVYLTESSWRNTATLSAAGKNSVFYLNFWLRDTDEKAGKKIREVPFAGRIIRVKDKKIIAVVSAYALRLNNNWETISISFRDPHSKSSTKLDEITTVNGKYRIELELDEKPYANYEFEVNNGKINGKQLPERRIAVSLPAKILNR